MIQSDASRRHPPLARLRGLFGRAAVTLSTMVAGPVSSARDGVSRGIIRTGIPANAVTLAGAVAASVVFVPAYCGSQPLAGIVLIVAGAFDLLDGAVARLSSGVTLFGGYLDSVVDRYSDFAVLLGILVYIDRYWEGPVRLLYLILWALSLVGTSTTAYARARAEAVIPRCKVGFMERPERMVTTILGLLSGNVHIALWILAVMTNMISIQRVLYARLRIAGREPRGQLWLWTYGRVTAPHFAMCTAFILILVFGHHLIPRP